MCPVSASTPENPRYKLCVHKKQILMLKACFHKEIFAFLYKRLCRDRGISDSEARTTPHHHRKLLRNFYPLCFCRDRGIFDSKARTTPQMLCHHPDDSTVKQPLLVSLRKEVIQPHLPIRLPCYDFTPVIGSTFDSSLLAVGSLASGISDSHGVTGGVYKTRERIHRSMLTCDY